MSSKLLPICWFYWRRFMREQPLMCGALLVAITAVLGAAFAHLSLQRLTADALASQAALRNGLQTASVPEPAIPFRESLQPFNSAQVVDTLNQVAERAGLSIDEVSFTLDEGAGQPFLRYRASLTLVAKYLAMRRFVDGVRAGLPDVSLDSITCSRKAISDAQLSCDLVFTAFYARRGRD